MIRKVIRDPGFVGKVGSVAGATLQALARDPACAPYVGRWMKSLLPGHTTLNDEVPWLTFPAIDWVDSYLRTNSRVFEYGSGGSSLFFSRRAGEVISLEHDGGFFDLMKGIVEERGIHNLDLRLVEPENDHLTLPYAVGNFRSLSPDFRTSSFERYVRTIEDFEDASFDLVVVDGRSRVSCVFLSAGKVKVGGYVLLDNAERPEYYAAQEWLVSKGFLEKRFRSLGPSNTYVWETAIFQRTR